MATKVSEQAVRNGVRGGSSDELRVFAQSVQAFTNASGTVIALSDGSAAEVICRARAGSSAPEVGTALRLEKTFIGLCIQSGKELRCDDTETDTRVDMAALRARGIRSMVVVPIKKEEGRVVGVLAAFAPGARAFSITHVAVLKTMAYRIADYLQGTHRNQASSPEPLPAPPAKAAAVSPAAPPRVANKPAVPAAASPMAPPAVAFKAAEPALTRRRLAVVPKVEPVRRGSPTSPSSRVSADIGNSAVQDTYTFAEKVDPARFSQKRETSSYHEQRESKTDFRPMFEAFNVAAAPKNRQRSNVLMIGAAVLLMIALAVEFSLILRPAAAPQPAVEPSSSPGTPAAPAPDAADMQPLATNTAPAPPAKRDPTEPKREALRKPEETVELLPGPSRISKAGDNPAQTSEAPAIFLGYMPGAGSLANLVIPVSQPPNPGVLRQSDFEPVTALVKVPPVYPFAAKQIKLTGSVVVQGTVNKNGRITDLQLMSGSQLFRDAAFAALKQWVFKPAKLNGQAIEQPAAVRLYFRDKGRPEEPAGVRVSRAGNQ